MANVETFGADRTDIESSKFKKYRGKDGQTDRIGIIMKDPKEMFKGLRAHFKERYFVCKSTKQKKEICCLHGYEGNRPRYRVGGVIVVYDLVVKDGKSKLKGYEVLPWSFGEKMYQKLVEINKEFPLESHDLKLTCTNEEFQNFDVFNCKESLWSSNPDLKAKILAEYETLIEEVARNLAADLSVTEIRELLGIDAAGSEDAASDVDLGTVIEGI